MRALLLPVLLVGCAQTVRFPPDLWEGDDLDDWGGVWIRDASVRWGCTPDETAWEGALDTEGWASSLSLTLVDGVASERHEMQLLSSDDAGSWDEYRIGPLTAGVPQNEQRPGVSSTFACTDAPAVVAMARDRDRNLADCVWWGGEPGSPPELVFADEVDRIGGCRRAIP